MVAFALCNPAALGSNHGSGEFLRRGFFPRFSDVAVLIDSDVALLRAVNSAKTGSLIQLIEPIQYWPHTYLGTSTQKTKAVYLP